MKTAAQALSKVNALKRKLTDKARREGLSENFGQSEIRRLRDDENCNPFGNASQRSISAIVDSLDNWCINLDLSQL